MSIDIKSYSQVYIKNLKSLLDELDIGSIDKAAEILWRAYQNKRKIFVVGNGGSASTASHMACDFNKTVRGHNGNAIWPGFRMISLTDNIPLITAWSNDISYDDAYNEQLKNLAEEQDVLIALSSSGNSPSILKCAASAKDLNLSVIGIAGFGGGRLKEICDLTIIIDINQYGPSEDIQLVLNHIFTGYFYQKFGENSQKNI